MSIQAVKDAKGVPNGRWCVAVMRDGKRIKRYTDDLDRAKEIERELKDMERAPSRPTKPVGMTLGELARKSGQIWADKRDKANSTRQLALVVEALGPDRPLRTLTYTMLADYAQELRDKPARRRKGKKGHDPKTVNRYLAALSKALSWAVDHDLLDKKPKVPKLAEGRGRISHLRDADTDGFVAWLRANREPRVAWCAEILAATGMRVQELLGLTEANLEDGWVRLFEEQTKGKESRYVPVPEHLQKPLAHMIEFGFPTYRVLYDGFVKASKVLGLTDKVTPHVLRHTTATQLTAKGVPTATVMRFLGHKHISTTMRYAHVQQEDLKRAQALLVRGNSGANPGAMGQFAPIQIEENQGLRLLREDLQSSA